MTDNHPDAPVPKAAAEIRRILLELPSDSDRRTALYRAAVCGGCGVDLMMRDGEPDFCYCRSDE